MLTLHEDALRIFPGKRWRSRTGRASRDERVFSGNVFSRIVVGLLLASVAVTFLLPAGMARVILMGMSALAVLAACASWASDGQAIRFSPLVMCWLFFLAYVFVNRGPVLANGGGVSWLIIFGSCVIVALFVASQRNSWSIVRAVFTVICLCALVHALATILFWIVPELYSQWFYPTFYSTKTIVGMGYRSALTNHYSTNGMYLSCGVLSVAFLLFIRPEGKSRHSLYLVLAILLFALILTTKRAQLLFSLAAIVFALILKRPRKGVTISLVAIGCAATVAALVFSGVFSYEGAFAVFARMGNADNLDTLSGRLDLYSLCLDMWGGSPLFGQGWDSFTEAFNLTEYGARKMSNGLEYTNAHNVFLQILAEEGIVGEVLFVFTVLLSVAVSARAALRLAGQARNYAIGSFMFQAFFLLYCLLGNPLYEFVEYVPYMVACSVPFRLYAEVMQGKKEELCNRETGQAYLILG